MWDPGLVWGLRTRWLSLRHSHASLLVGAICVQASFSAGKNQALKFKKAKIFVVFFFGYNLFCLALAGVAQWTECGPENHRVTNSIPVQGTCLGCRPGPHWGCVRVNHTWMFLSLSFSLHFPLSKNK